MWWTISRSYSLGRRFLCLAHDTDQLAVAILADCQLAIGIDHGSIVLAPRSTDLGQQGVGAPFEQALVDLQRQAGHRDFSLATPGRWQQR